MVLAIFKYYHLKREKRDRGVGTSEQQRAGEGRFLSELAGYTGRSAVGSAVRCAGVLRAGLDSQAPQRSQGLHVLAAEQCQP